MKKYLLLLAFFISAFCFSQTDTTQKEAPLTIVEQMPSFPGGQSEMMKFIQQNVKYPQAERESNIGGTVYVTFVVEKDGGITNVRTLRGVSNGPGCDKEAMRVVSIMPKWEPGKQNGKEVRVQFNLPVKFSLRASSPLTLQDTIYMDKDGKRCDKAVAEYFRIIEKKDNIFLIKDFYMKNKNPQMVSVCSSYSPLIQNGKTTYFYLSGEKQMEGNYENNKKINRWVELDENGKDSSIIFYNIDGTFKFERYSKSMFNNDKIYDIAEIMPTFPGGDNSMMQFIQKNIKYPDRAKKFSINGTCYISFIVEKDGLLTEIILIRRVMNCPECDQEALKTIHSMPKWTPGKINGVIVRTRFNLPIKFTLR